MCGDGIGPFILTQSANIGLDMGTRGTETSDPRETYHWCKSKRPYCTGTVQSRDEDE